MSQHARRRAPATIVKTTRVYISRADWAAMSPDFKIADDGDPKVMQRSEITGASELRRAAIVDDVAAVHVEPDPVTAELIHQIGAQLPASITPRAFEFDEHRAGWVYVFLPSIARSAVIEYVHGRDLYAVAVNDTTNTGAVLVGTRHEGVFADQLGELLARPRRGSTQPLFVPIPMQLEVRVTGWDEFPDTAV